MSRIILKPTTDKLSLVTLCKLGSAGGSGLPPVTDVDGRAVIEVGGVAEFRTIDDSYVGGGWHAVLDLTARDAIPAEVRKIGLRCRVTSLSETYELVGGITNANWFLVTESPLVTATTTALTFPVDYNDPNAVDPPNGTIFESQAEIDAFLVDESATNFKHLQPVLSALPAQVKHVVTISLAVGVHRPRPTDTDVAWELTGKTVFAGGSVSIVGPDATTWDLLDPTLAGLLITSADGTGGLNASGDAWFDIWPTSNALLLADLDVRGRFFKFSNGDIRIFVERWVYPPDGWGGNTQRSTTPLVPNVDTFDILKGPIAELRNSLDDLVPVAATSIWVDVQPSGMSGDVLSLSNVTIKEVAGVDSSMTLLHGPYYLYRVFVDSTGGDGDGIQTSAQVSLDECVLLGQLGVSQYPIHGTEGANVEIVDCHIRSWFQPLQIENGRLVSEQSDIRDVGMNDDATNGREPGHVVLINSEFQFTSPITDPVAPVRDGRDTRIGRSGVYPFPALGITGLVLNNSRTIPVLPGTPRSIQEVSPLYGDYSVVNNADESLKAIGPCVIDVTPNDIPPLGPLTTPIPWVRNYTTAKRPWLYGPNALGLGPLWSADVALGPLADLTYQYWLASLGTGGVASDGTNVVQRSTL